MNNCSECDTNKEHGNFCSNCGKKLREKCPDGCGKMEKIGRIVCENDYDDAMCKLKEYQEEGRGKWFLIWALTMVMLPWTSGYWLINLLWPHNENAISICFFAVSLVIIVSCFPLMLFLAKREKKREIEFLQKFSRYAEIIKKSEGRGGE